MSHRVRELAMLVALVAPSALAQQAPPVSFEASWSKVSGGAGSSSADRFSVVGMIDSASGTSSAGSFSVSGGMMGSQPVGSAPNDAIFLNGFD
jgi:hypothetical protein